MKISDALRKGIFDNQERLFRIFAFGLSAALLITTLIRASVTGITYDEAYTYLKYVSHWKESIYYIFMPGALANHHILNTFSIIFLEKITSLRYSEFLIRLPNIIAYSVYLYYCFKITRNMRFRYFDMAFLASAYFVNEMFGLARGYGIATALVTVSLYYWINWMDSNQERDRSLVLSMLFMTLACYANSIVLFIFFSILVCAFVLLIQKKRVMHIIRNYYLVIVPLAVMTLVIIRFHFLVSAPGRPMPGNSRDFVRYLMSFPTMVTNNSLVKYLFFFAFFILILVTAFLKLLLKKEGSVYLILPALINILIIGVLVPLLNKGYPETRVVLPSWPLTAIALLELAEFCAVQINSKFNRQNRKSKNYIGNIAQITLTIMLLLSFVDNISLNHTQSWKSDYSLKALSLRLLDNREIEHEVGPVLKFYRGKYLLELGIDILPDIEQ